MRNSKKDEKIDELVYELYGIIEVERKIIEGKKISPKATRKSGSLKHDKIDYLSFSVCYFHG